MLRAVSRIYCEGQALEKFTNAKRDVFKIFRASAHTGSPGQTVLTSDSCPAPQPASPPPHNAPPSSPQPPPPPSSRTWTFTAAALLTASLGGAYFYRRFSEVDEKKTKDKESTVSNKQPQKKLWGDLEPATGSAFPTYVEYLLIGGGTASFAALRAIRSARPTASVLVVGEERTLPYMRPPLSKELWREQDLPERAESPDSLTFTQWNGKRRSVLYEPSVFYTPVEELKARIEAADAVNPDSDTPEDDQKSELDVGGVAVARGWTVSELNTDDHSVKLRAPGQQPVTLEFYKCLIATGVRPARVPALKEAAENGKSVVVRGLQDVSALARRLADCRSVAVVGGGLLATELSAALATSPLCRDVHVTQLFRERAALTQVLPQYLADDVTRRLHEANVTTMPDSEVVSSKVLPKKEGSVRLMLKSGDSLDVDLVVECVGSKPNVELAEKARLELDSERGGILVNAELQARSDIFAAGDVVSYFDEAFGRRRVEHHDHAVVSGRLAGENMARVVPAKPYRHHSMFWSDLGPQLGYEAIGIVDSRLPTVGVFSANAVSDVQATASVSEAATSLEVHSKPATSHVVEQTTPERNTDDAAAKRYERGVVFYMKEKRVVGILLWNLFNRMHVARQVLTAGEFEDLFEVAKLFSPQEEE